MTMGEHAELTSDSSAERASAALQPAPDHAPAGAGLAPASLVREADLSGALAPIARARVPTTNRASRVQRSSTRNVADQARARDTMAVSSSASADTPRVARSRSLTDAAEPIQQSVSARIQRREDGPSAIAQPLIIGSANDPAEAEADALADRVVGRIAIADRSVPTSLTPEPRMVHRRAAGPASGPAGRAVDDETSAEIRHAQRGGQPLDANVRRSMEQGFGADFSQVRVHSGPQSDDLNARLGAQAFTVGSDIFFGGGVPDTSSVSGQHLVAHELTHTLQQSGQQIGQRSTGTVVRRLEVGARPIEDGYAKILSHPKWRTEAAAYEKRLGSLAYNHPKSIKAARAGLRRMALILRDYYKADYLNIHDLYRTAFTKDDTSSAGQVGKHMSDHAQFDMLFNNGGNLREVMTAFYNGAYYNAGYGANLNPSLKAILHEVTIGKKFNLASRYQLDEADLRRRSSALLSWSRAVKHKAALLANKDKAHIFSQDIFALGELAGSIGNAAELAMSQMPRSDRTDEDKSQGAAKKTPREYAAMGAPLSANERAYLEAKDKPLTVEGFDIVEVYSE